MATTMFYSVSTRSVLIAEQMRKLVVALNEDEDEDEDEDDTCNTYEAGRRNANEADQLPRTEPITPAPFCPRHLQHLHVD